MALYDSQITIFNYDSQTQKFKAELITQVECQKWYEIDEEVGYTENFDSMLVIIRFSMVSDIKTTSNGKKFCYPQEYQELPDKSGFFTFNTYKDFFAIGNFTTYDFTTLETFKNDYPDLVFTIKRFNEYTSVLPHWELFSYKINARY